MSELEYLARLIGGRWFLSIQKYCLRHNILKNFWGSSKCSYYYWKFFNFPLNVGICYLKEIGPDYNPYVIIRVGDSSSGIPLDKWDPEVDSYIKNRKVYQEFKKQNIGIGETFTCRMMIDSFPNIPLRVTYIDWILKHNLLTKEEVQEFFKSIEEENNDKD